MRSGETSLGAPPVCPQFPLPPGEDDGRRTGGAQNVDASNKSHWVKEPGTGAGAAPHAAAASATTRPIFVQEPHTLREEYANTAIQLSAEHWIHEQARREATRRGVTMGARDVLGEAFGDVGGEGGEAPPEFVTGSPKYVLRVGLLLIIGLFGAIPLMSSFALTVLLTGCIVTYIVDFSGHRRVCVLAIMCTTGAFAIALFLSNLHAAVSSVGPLCMILSVFGLLLTTAMAAFLHFHWMQLTYPELIFLLERCVLGVTPLIALPSMLTTVTAFVGSRHAPAWFLLCMCVLHYYFGGPMESSFLVQRRRVRKGQVVDGAAQHDDDDETDEMVALQANERFEAITLTVLLLILPTLLYISFQSNWADAWVSNSLNALGMFSGPVLYLCWDPARSLWFLLPEKQHNVQSRLERDPLGVHDFVGKCRRPFLVLSLVFTLHWCIYRLLHSRYRFLFNGVPPPFNGICLAIAMYAGVFTAYQIKVLLDTDRRGENTLSRQYLEVRAFSVGAAIVSCVFLGIAAGTPGPFILLMVLCVTSFNFFLLDRTNSGPMVSFTVFSSLLLLWWMYRMFSFIVLDLHVLGESATVPTPVLAINVLWCYVLSCIAFTLSFSKNTMPFFLALFIQSLQVAWVEHVLYSQKEENVYPAVLVLLTTVVGVFLASRLYKNGKLGISEAAVISASYFAKLPTFLVEVTGSYYLSEFDQERRAKYHAVEITMTWWAALLVGYVVVLFELERGRRQMVGANARRLSVMFLIGAVAVTICTARNFQRAVFEFVTQSRFVDLSAMHVVTGTSCVFLSVLTYPFFARHAGLYTFLYNWKTLARGAFALGLILLVTQPTRIMDNESVLEYDVNEDNMRYFSCAGILLLVVGQYLPIKSLHFILRALYWLFATGCLSVGLSMYLLPVFSLLIFAGVCGFVYCSLLTIDIAHYRNTTSNEEWIVYAVSICFMLYSLVAMGRVDVRAYVSDNPLFTWDIYTLGRRRLLAIVCVTSLFTSVMLNFRLHGRPLLHGTLPLTKEMFQRLGVLANYATILSVVSLTMLNIWSNGNEPVLHVATSPLLLLMVEDEMLLQNAWKSSFRYFPPLLYSVSLLWGCLIWDAYRSGLTVTGGIFQSVLGVICASPVIPSQVSLLLLLWFGKKRGGTPLSGVLVFVSLDMICLLFSSNQIIQWMAIIGVCGQCARLFDSQFWKRRLEMVL